MAELAGRKVLLGVTGGIAVYKAAELARMLARAGADVKVIMTGAGQQFVSPLTFRTLTGNPVATTMWSDPGSPFPHISLSDEADLIVVAPATANIVAKMANGIADDLLSTTVLAARGTIVVAPAMNTRMYLNQATQSNLERIREMGVVVVDPGEGGLACGTEGIGRMAEPAEIMEVVERELAVVRDLDGRRVLVTAGPTREHIDPVRFFSNPSTGRMGYTIARQAARRGADVILISGPVELSCQADIELVKVVSASEMLNAVLDNFDSVDVLVMAAAVADFTSTEVAGKKLKKNSGVPDIKLEPTTDILGEVALRKNGRVVVGFAAETDQVIMNAKKKLKEKNLDLIVANKVGEFGTGFGSMTDMAVVIGDADTGAELKMMSKIELADVLLDRIRDLLK